MSASASAAAAAPVPFELLLSGLQPEVAALVHQALQAAFDAPGSQMEHHLAAAYEMGRESNIGVHLASLTTLDGVGVAWGPAAPWMERERRADTPLLHNVTLTVMLPQPANAPRNQQLFNVTLCRMMRVQSRAQLLARFNQLVHDEAWAEVVEQVRTAVAQLPQD